jgi:hypothetical protein
MKHEQERPAPVEMQTVVMTEIGDLLMVIFLAILFRLTLTPYLVQRAKANPIPTSTPTIATSAAWVVTMR